VVPDGNRSRLFVWGGHESFELVRYDQNSQRVEPLLPEIQTVSLSLSTDGSWLAFPNGDALWKAQLDGSNRHSLAAGLGPIGAIRWSPDDKRILFHSARGGEFGRDFLVSADGGTPAEVSLGIGHNEPGWSPDGQSIVYSKIAQEGGVEFRESGIYEVNVQTSRTTKIPGSEGLTHANYSPDGRFLMAVTIVHLNPTQPVTLKLYDVRKREWRDIDKGTLLSPAAWSPDSKYLYYQDILGQDEPVFRYAVGAAKPQLLFDFSRLLHSGYSRCGFVRFAPNGDVVASLTRSETDLYRLDMDLP
jgi:Tol biopolymer transport system component